MDINLKETYLRECTGYLMQTFYEFKRGEGLYTLVDHFFHTNNVMLSYHLSSLLLSVPCPQNGSVEFDIKLYVYDRYILHAKITETMNLLFEARESIKFALSSIDETKEESKPYLDECAAIFDNIVKKTTK